MLESSPGKTQSGDAPDSGRSVLAPVPPFWHDAERGRAPFEIPDGDTIPEIFLEVAAAGPNRPILADQSGGVKTFRDVVAAIFILKPRIEKIPGEYAGIMMPSASATAIVYLATLFAGKTPVMLNWTAGKRNILHGLKRLGVEKILTSSVFARKLAARGFDLSDLESKFIHLDEERKNIGFFEKIGCAFKSRVSWRALEKAKIREHAAVLFTSGSENLPKAVPLTHRNIVANLKCVMSRVKIVGTDSIMGILPPFHVFGLSTNVALPFVSGVRVVFHHNPTEGNSIARLIEHYRTSIIIGTPTFLNCVNRSAKAGELRHLRLAVTGAEKCSDALFDGLARNAPNLKVLEGYGITECSPIVAVNRPECPVKGSIGPVLDSMEYALVHPESGIKVEKGEKGVLLLRGPSVFSGYLNHDGESPFVEHDGRKWYRTGDLVVECGDGNLSFAGRLKRFVKIGGEMVSLPAVEEVLSSRFQCGHSEDGPALAVEAQCGDGRPELVLFAAIDVSREDANSAIRDGGLSPLHNIRRVVKLDKIPLLGTGKTDYRELASMLEKAENR